MTVSAGNDCILAVDCGATSIKSALVTPDGRIISPLRRRRTPLPCLPETFIDLVVRRLAKTPAARVGVGFPGEMRHGVVVGTGNLARESGPGSEQIPAVVAAWQGRNLSLEISRATSANVCVVNDATMAALGCGGGYGVELVVTLGTGCGLALMRDGDLEPVPDVGALPTPDGRSFDQVMGERARSLNEAQWRVDVRDTLSTWQQLWGVERFYLAGGNAPRLQHVRDQSWPHDVVIVGNLAALRGAARLFVTTGTSGSVVG